MIYPLSLCALTILFASPFHAAAQVAEAPADEIVVDVLPSKGKKYDPVAIYREDQEVLQGILGTGGDDELNGIAFLPSSEIIAVGRIGDPKAIPAAIPRTPIQGLAPTGNAFVAVFDPTFRKLQQMMFLPSDVSTLRAVKLGSDNAIYLCGPDATPNRFSVLKIDSTLSKLIWRASFEGNDATSMVVMPDHSVVVHTGGAFISRIKSDGSGLMPWGSQARFRIDRANPAIEQKYWIDLGYKEKGFRDQGFLKGGVSQLGLTPDGNLAILACHSIRIPSGSPDFDAMLVKFNTEGEVLWAANLAQGIPNEPDNKYPRLYVDPHSGDLIVSLTQHGHFGPGHDLEVTPGCYLTTDAWLTGDILVGWVGRVDPLTGDVKAATMYFPDTGKPPRGGKRTAGSLFPEALGTDKEGRIYVAGASAYKLATTKYAFQPESLGGSGFVSVFSPDLSKLLYANLITAQGYSVRPNHLVVTERGPIVASKVTPPKAPPHHLVTANAEKTNFLTAQAAGATDVLFSLLPSKNWFEEWSD